MALWERFINNEKFLPSTYQSSSYLIYTGQWKDTTLSAYSFMNGVYPKGFNSVNYQPGTNPLKPEDYNLVLQSPAIKNLH